MLEQTNYGSFYDKEPETIEDLIPPSEEEDPTKDGVAFDEQDAGDILAAEEEPEVEEEPVSVEEEPEVEEELVVVEEEPVLDISKRVRVEIDSVARLMLRETPAKDGLVLEKLSNGTLLTVLDDSDSVWLFVATDGSDKTKGYVKKLYVVDE